jgi:hypothetical protein
VIDFVWIGLAFLLCFAFWLGVACGRFEPIIWTRANLPSARSLRRAHRRQKADLRAALTRGGRS